ncbi:MAG: TetR/AcrR family transcriptional regulator [Spirochaetota bacterium]
MNATQERLYRALADLTNERGYAAVTVRALLRRAGVRRLEFARFYRGRDDLLERGTHALCDEIIEQFETWNWERASGAGGRLPSFTPSHITMLFDIARDERPVFAAFLDPRSPSLFRRIITRRFEDYIYRKRIGPALGPQSDDRVAGQLSKMMSVCFVAVVEESVFEESDRERSASVRGNVDIYYRFISLGLAGFAR